MNWSIDASKFEQVTHPLTAANVPPTMSIGVAIGVRSGFNPTTLTSTACVAPVALMLTVEPPLREMLLKLYLRRRTAGDEDDVDVRCQRQTRQR